MNHSETTVRLLKPPYKSPQGKWYTAALFYERQIRMPLYDRPIYPIFTLYDDKPDLISARKTFVALGDPTGYDWSVRYLGDWNHWQELMEAPWFREAVEVWRKELAAKQRAEAIKTITKIAKNPEDKQALAAAKYVAEQAWDKQANTRGRPTKAEVRGELKKAIEQASIEDEDMARIGLVKKG